MNEAATNASIKGTVSGTPSFETNFKVGDGDTKNVPLQSESKNGFNFGANLFTDSQIQINQIELKPEDPGSKFFGFHDPLNADPVGNQLSPR